MLDSETPRARAKYTIKVRYRRILAGPGLCGGPRKRTRRPNGLFTGMGRKQTFAPDFCTLQVADLIEANLRCEILDFCTVHTDAGQLPTAVSKSNRTPSQSGAVHI